MSINITSDYAIRILLYLAEHSKEDHSVSGKEISEEMRIPYNYFLKIIPNLKNAGMLISFQGKKGGYILQRRADQISLYDVLEAVDDRLVYNQCLEEPKACSRNASGHCAVHNFFSDLQVDLDHSLKNVTIADMVANQHDMNTIDSAN